MKDPQAGHVGSDDWFAESTPFSAVIAVPHEWQKESPARTSVPHNEQERGADMVSVCHPTLEESRLLLEFTLLTHVCN